MDYDLAELLQDIPQEVTPQERNFCREYLANGRDARAAALAVGVESGKAEKRGRDWLRMPRIRKELNDQRSDSRVSTRRHDIERSVIDEMAAIAFSDVRGLYDPLTGRALPVHLWPDSVAAAVKSVKFEPVVDGDGLVVRMELKAIQFYDKPRALHLLMLHAGMLDETVRLQLSDGIAARLDKALAEANARRG